MKTLDGPEYYGWTIFCDDIRREIGSKITYVGAYPSKMLVHGDFPITLPKFGLGVTYVQHRATFVSPSKLFVFLPGDEDDKASIEAEIDPASVPNLPDDPNPNAVMAVNAILLLSPLTIKEAGHIKVRAVRGDGLVRLGAIEIERAPKDAQQ